MNLVKGKPIKVPPGNAMWMTFLWLTLDLEFGKPNDGLCYVALSLVSLRLD